VQKQEITDEIKSFYWIGKNMSKDNIRQFLSQNIGETFITNS
jgi:hypothetical protein